MSFKTNAPSNHCGEVSGLAWVPKIFFASCWSAIDIPKVANKVSNGRLYNHLITRRSINTPAENVTKNARGMAIIIDMV